MYSPNRNLLAARAAYEEQKEIFSMVPGLYTKTFTDFYREWINRPPEFKQTYFDRLDAPEKVKEFAEKIYGKSVFNLNPVKENPFVMQVNDVDLNKIGNGDLYNQAWREAGSSKNPIIQEFINTKHSGYYDENGVLNLEAVVNSYIKKYAGSKDLKEFLDTINNIKEIYENNLPYFEVLQKNFDIADWDTIYVPKEQLAQAKKALKSFNVEIKPYGDGDKKFFENLSEEFKINYQKRGISPEDILEREYPDLPRTNEYSYSDFANAKIQRDRIFKRR